MQRFKSRIARSVAVTGLLALGVHQAHAAQIRSAVVDNFNVISIIGDIVEGDADRFKAIQAQTTDTTGVFLNSNGGQLIEGLEIGEAIRAKGYQTIVGDHDTCASVCGLMWLAGSVRLIARTGHVGFHLAYTGNAEDSKESGRGNAFVGAYLMKLGYSYDTVAFATSAAPDQMRWLHPDDAAKVGIEVTLLPETTPEQSTTAVAIVTPADESAAGDDSVVAASNALSPEQLLASGTRSYAEGRQDRINNETWFTALSDGPFQWGATYWTSHRSDKPTPTCFPAQGASLEWQAGCLAAKLRLDTPDFRRKTDKNYWWGWNSL